MKDKMTLYNKTDLLMTKLFRKFGIKKISTELADYLKKELSQYEADIRADENKKVLEKLLDGEQVNHAELFDRLKKHPKYPHYDNYSIDYLAGRVRESTLTSRALHQQLLLSQSNTKEKK